MTPLNLQLFLTEKEQQQLQHAFENSALTQEVFFKRRLLQQTQDDHSAFLLELHCLRSLLAWQLEDRAHAPLTQLWLQLDALIQEIHLFYQCQ